MKKQPFLTIIMIVLCYTNINAKNMTCTEHMNAGLNLQTQ